MPDEVQGPPPYWEALSSTREQMARIETKLDMVLSQQNLNISDLDVVKSKIASLEAGRAANAADIATARAEAGAARDSIASYDISPAQFKAWKTEVDNVISAFKNMTLAVATRTQLRAQDWALLCGVATVVGAIIGNVPALVGLFGAIGIAGGISLLGALF